MMRPRGGDPANGFLGGWPGWAAELVYARAAAWARRRALAAPVVRCVTPVLSIGNLAVGGTGKTPFAAWTARRLTAAGHRVALVARPVGGPVPGAEGDEIALLRALVPDVPVHAVRAKAEGAAAAAAALAAQGPGGVVVVDDAFSHPRLARDLDVVLLDAARPLGNGHLLPYGPLREPPGALARAGAIVLTRADRLDAATLARTHEAIGRLAPGVPQAAGALVPAGARRAADGAAHALAPGERLLCVSGLARPGELAWTARRLGADVAGEAVFPDHHRFTTAEWRGARAEAARRGARLAVSAKDAARLAVAQREDVLVLDVAFAWHGDAAAAREVERAIDQAARGKP